MKNSALSPPTPRIGSTAGRSPRRSRTGRRGPRATTSDGAAAVSTSRMSTRLGLRVGHHVDVDLARLLDRPRADALVEDACPPRPSRDSHTSWVAFISLANREGGGTSSPTTVCRVAPRLEASSRTLPICGADTPAGRRRARRGPPSVRRSTSTRSGMPCAPGLRLRAAGDRDHDSLAGLPGRGDLVVLAVLRERGIDLIGEPQQRDFPKRGQIALAGSSWSAPGRSFGRYTLP